VLRAAACDAAGLVLSLMEHFRKSGACTASQRMTRETHSADFRRLPEVADAADTGSVTQLARLGKARTRPFRLRPVVSHLLTKIRAAAPAKMTDTLLRARAMLTRPQTVLSVSRTTAARQANITCNLQPQQIASTICLMGSTVTRRCAPSSSTAMTRASHPERGRPCSSGNGGTAMPSAKGNDFVVVL
jgi:hypothetical protein